tara:strand:+ start:903 stop:1595 length:693 start_codon:yes stop_codon:yes gene_type:complete
MTKKILGFIPARGGSKSIHLKNIVPICGVPLIKYCIDASLKSKIIDKLICSTDNKEIASIASASGCEIDLRPEHLAGDEVNVHCVVKDFLKRTSEKYEYVFLIQPTSPLIEPSDFINLLKAIKVNEKFLTAHNISNIPHNFHALNQRRIEDGQVEFVFEEDRKTYFNKQLKPKYFCFGNLCLSKYKNLINNGTFFQSPSAYEIINWPRNIDVDGIDDVKILEILMNLNLV